MPIVEADLSFPDRCELRAGRLTLEKAVTAGHEAGGLTFTMLDHTDGGTPMGLFGFSPWEDNTGLVWAMTTDRLRRHRIRFHRISKQWVNWMHAICPLLTNVVWAGNLGHILWLQRLGFVIIRKHEVNGEPYFEFVRIGP